MRVKSEMRHKEEMKIFFIHAKIRSYGFLSPVAKLEQHFFADRIRFYTLHVYQKLVGASRF